jgi:hypothetical protein
MLQGPGDRRLGLSTGPLQMVPGDTQVVVIAEIAGGTIDDIDYLSAIDTVKKYSVIAQDFYDTQFPLPVSVNDETVLPQTFELDQNYPNPFNPSTIINFSLPSSGYATLKIYNALGEEVAVLLDEKLTTGTYQVDWNAGGLSSGVYFYQLKTEGYVETKKMILMK